MLEFPKSAVDVGERQRREGAEAIGLLRDEVGRVFVDAARHLPSLVLVPADDARRGQRENPGGDLLRVHGVDRALGRPWRNNGARGISAQLLCPEGRYDMLINVNAKSSAHVLLLCGAIRETLLKAFPLSIRTGTPGFFSPALITAGRALAPRRSFPLAAPIRSLGR